MILLIGTISILFIIGTVFGAIKLIDYLENKYNRDIDYYWIWLLLIIDILIVVQVLYSLKLIN